MQSQTVRSYRSSGVLRLNRILFDPSEIDIASPECGDEFIACVTLPKNDYRTIHVAKILGLRNGDTLRAGSVRCPRLEEANELAGLVTDDATIMWLPEGKIKKAQPTANGEPPGSLRIFIPKSPKTLLWGDRKKSQMTEGDIDLSTVPPVSLLLALPRPLQLGRILPMVTQLGVDHIILTNAKKVPKVGLLFQFFEAGKIPILFSSTILRAELIELHDYTFERIILVLIYLENQKYCVDCLWKV